MPYYTLAPSRMPPFAYKPYPKTLPQLYPNRQNPHIDGKIIHFSFSTTRGTQKRQTRGGREVLSIGRTGGSWQVGGGGGCYRTCRLWLSDVRLRPLLPPSAVFRRGFGQLSACVRVAGLRYVLAVVVSGLLHVDGYAPDTLPMSRSTSYNGGYVASGGGLSDVVGGPMRTCCKSCSITGNSSATPDAMRIACVIVRL